MKTTLLTIMLAGAAYADMNIIALMQEQTAREARSVRMERPVPPKRVKKVKVCGTVAKTDRVTNRKLRAALKEYIRTDHPLPIFWGPNE